MKVNVKKNDQVLVMTGRDRGARGRVLRVLASEGKAIVERVNMIKRHTRPNPSKNIAGGISEKEAPLHISNVMLVDPDGNTRTRIGRRRDADGAPERFAKKSGAALT
jgi:large subunit ribosomal protein L24